MLVDYWKAGRTDGKTIRSTSYNFYGTNAVRASAADIEDALVRTDTYKGDHEKTASTILQSKTFFFTGFGKGDEIADYSEAFRTDGTTMRTTSYNFLSTNALSPLPDNIEDAL